MSLASSAEVSEKTLLYAYLYRQLWQEEIICHAMLKMVVHMASHLVQVQFMMVPIGQDLYLIQLV